MDQPAKKRPLAHWLIKVSVTFVTVAALANLGRAQEARPLAQEGKSLVDAGKYDLGCPKLEQAWKLDSELLGAGFTLGECYERQGKLVSAWNTFSTVAQKAAARREARAKEAQARADKLKPRLSTLTVTIPPELAEAPGLQVKIGEMVLSADKFGSAIPFDGGQLKVVVSANGRATWSREVTIPNEGGKLEVAAELGAPEAVTEPENKSDPTFFTPLRIGGFVAGGVGVASLAVATAFGVLAMQRLDESNAEGGCNETTNVCSRQLGVDLRSESLLFGDVSTAMFVIGGLAAAASVVLIAIPIDADDASAAFVVSPMYAGIEGSWN